MRGQYSNDTLIDSLIRDNLEIDWVAEHPLEAQNQEFIQTNQPSGDPKLEQVQAHCQNLKDKLDVLYQSIANIQSSGQAILELDNVIVKLDELELGLDTELDAIYKISDYLNNQQLQGDTQTVMVNDLISL